jgi:hypothetical protein
MADRIIVENPDPPPPTPPPSDRVIDLAAEVGAMRERELTRQGDLAEVRSLAARALDSVQSLSETVSGLSRQTESAERTAEAAATVAVATAEAVKEGEEEDQGGVLEVTPEVETHIQIDQVPVKNRTWLQKILFGK